jgi:endonuclease-8
MPEGDTIHKIAHYLALRLVNRTVQRLHMNDTGGAAACTGKRIRTVFAHGKHLFIELADDLTLRSHLGMYGSWHRYAENERWRKPRWQASLELATDKDVFVCFNAKETELMRTPGFRERTLRARLGPDLVGPETDIDHVVRRAREFPESDTLLADVLLDQRVASGIGNVYKSEVLFIEGCLPHTRLSAVSDESLARCFASAAVLLRRNLGGGPRVTRFEEDNAGRLWVYRRRGLHCLRCDDRISSARLGKDHRSTYWCPSCQG